MAFLFTDLTGTEAFWQEQVRKISLEGIIRNICTQTMSSNFCPTPHPYKRRKCQQ